MSFSIQDLGYRYQCIQCQIETNKQDNINFNTRINARIDTVKEIAAKQSFLTNLFDLFGIRKNISTLLQYLNEGNSTAIIEIENLQEQATVILDEAVHACLSTYDGQPMGVYEIIKIESAMKSYHELRLLAERLEILNNRVIQAIQSSSEKGSVEFIDLFSKSRGLGTMAVVTTHEAKDDIAEVIHAAKMTIGQLKVAKARGQVSLPDSLLDIALTQIIITLNEILSSEHSPTSASCLERCNVSLKEIKESVSCLHTELDSRAIKHGRDYQALTEQLEVKLIEMVTKQLINHFWSKNHHPCTNAITQSVKNYIYSIIIQRDQDDQLYELMQTKLVCKLEEA